MTNYARCNRCEQGTFNTYPTETYEYRRGEKCMAHQVCEEGKLSVDFQVLKNFSKVNFCEIFSDEVILRNGTDQEDNVCGKLGETLPPVEAVLPPGPPPLDTALDGKFRVRCDINEGNLRERPHYRRKKDFGNFGYIPTCCIPTYCDKGEARILMFVKY